MFTETTLTDLQARKTQIQNSWLTRTGAEQDALLAEIDNLIVAYYEEVDALEGN